MLIDVQMAWWLCGLLWACFALLWAIGFTASFVGLYHTAKDRSIAGILAMLIAAGYCGMMNFVSVLMAAAHFGFERCVE